MTRSRRQWSPAGTPGAAPNRLARDAHPGALDDFGTAREQARAGASQGMVAVLIDKAATPRGGLPTIPTTTPAEAAGGGDW